VEITEIRIKLMEDSEDRLRAFCSITIDSCFVVRDLKIIDGSNGPFVAMPSRKLTGHCQRCNHKNHLRASYCNHCGKKLHSDGDGGYDSPQKLYADVAHPINSECRELIQDAVITEFEAELNRCKQPGYRSRYDDDFGYEDVDADDVLAVEPATSEPPKPDAPSRKSEAGPPRPHFIDRPKKQEPATENDDDNFGAGIF
jgi:stage V sporulation protein G